MTVGERIKYFRNSKNMTQDDLASKTGTTKQTIYKYENNIITNIPSDKIEMIARALDVSPVILMGWDKKYMEVEQQIEMETYKAAARNRIDDVATSVDEKYNAKLQEYLALYARSVNASRERGESYHPDFDLYVAMMLNQKYQKESMPLEIYERLIKKYGTSSGIDEGSSYWHPKHTSDTEIHTIAAHHEGEEWTQEELDEIEEFKKFVLSKRNK